MNETTNPARPEWERVRDELTEVDKDIADQHERVWEVQRRLSDQVRALLVKMIFEEELIPKTGWHLPPQEGKDRLDIHHEASSHDAAWKPLIEVWSNQGWSHGSLVLTGTELDEEVALRIDDSEMSILFKPPSRLSEFLKSYGLTVQADALAETKRGLEESLQVVEALMKALEVD